MKMASIFPALVAIGSTLFLAGNAFSDPGVGSYGNHPMLWNNMFMGPMMMTVMVVFVVVVVVLIVRLFSSNGQTSGSDSYGQALTILSERFAKGEIDKAEYEESKKMLGG